ncbi:hypothetical protein DFH07DRAFT_838408 [Mycena maculata]|uniref:DUF6533 domain-containing protein n=1 Tax=Mycena maculata TaxID=230809 RepID=A0AAD7IG37_9AGAR|nr:hypothetical protein DFH07DRAFT_838408 [Mycena maculata]
MSAPASEVTVQLLVDVRASRYISAAGLTILLYDHLLSLPDEVRFIWSARFTSSKFLFLATRYLVPSVMLVQTILNSGISDRQLPTGVSSTPIIFSNSFLTVFSCECSSAGKCIVCLLPDISCKAWMPITVLMAWIALATNNWLLLLRLWILWDRDRIFIVSTLLVFLAMHITAFVFAWLSVAQMIPTLFFEPSLHLCTLIAPSKLGTVWIPTLTFESMVVLAMGWKVLTRPRTLKALHDDGFGIFFVLYGVSLTNTVIFFTARPTLLFVMFFFTWSFATTATSRMILNLRCSSERARLGDENGDASDTSHETDFQRPRSQLVELSGMPCP